MIGEFKSLISYVTVSLSMREDSRSPVTAQGVSGSWEELVPSSLVREPLNVR